ncbi:putative glycerol kinase 5 [Cichlidogyrus casuarinus]|uniref:Glycerol kinase 5 n=1 Tax=Cichlidogyrus casuarinus TaxID=1844966 RepID=A0ABD2QJ93_9PLAT
MALLKIPRNILPEIRPSFYNFGKAVTLASDSEAPLISCVMGDSQAACITTLMQTGQAKLTLGTGAFLNILVGNEGHLSAYPTGFYPLIGWCEGPICLSTSASSNWSSSGSLTSPWEQEYSPNSSLHEVGNQTDDSGIHSTVEDFFQGLVEDERLPASPSLRQCQITYLAEASFKHCGASITSILRLGLCNSYSEMEALLIESDVISKQSPIELCYFQESSLADFEPFLKSIGVKDRTLSAEPSFLPPSNVLLYPKRTCSSIDLAESLSMNPTPGADSASSSNRALIVRAIVSNIAFMIKMLKDSWEQSGKLSSLSSWVSQSSKKSHMGHPERQRKYQQVQLADAVHGASATV